MRKRELGHGDMGHGTSMYDDMDMGNGEIWSGAVREHNPGGEFILQNCFRIVNKNKRACSERSRGGDKDIN